MSTENLSYKIHVFGDSHTRLYSSKNLKNYVFNVYYIQNINIKDFYQQNTTIEDLIDTNNLKFRDYLQNAKPQYKHMPIPTTDINKNDIIIFVLGEIDVRQNLENELNEGKDLNLIIENWVNNYIECIKMNRERHPGVKFGLQSVLSTTDNKNYHVPVEWIPTIDTEIRKKATLELNKLLKQKCIENDLLFVDITEYYTNDESDYPVPGLDVNAGLNELDTRIKDEGAHVNMEHPEGIEITLEKLGVPSNIIKTESFEDYSNFFYSNLLLLLLLLLFFVMIIFIVSYKSKKSLFKFLRIT